ncbi:MAG: hypothetical protein H7Z41_02150 [Cytophagales bacterium]|nr:hypothetical protein [Armatimonadota bacterium]
MSLNDESMTEVRRIRRMLKQMYRLAEHSSLTGALSGGAVDAVSQYNAILKRLGELAVVSGTLFPVLPEDASFDRLGVASRLLEGYLEEETPETEGRGAAGHNIVIGNIGGLEDLKDLGRMVRENLPEFLRKRTSSDAPEVPGEPPTPPTPPSGDPAFPNAAAREEAPIPMPDLSR